MKNNEAFGEWCIIEASKSFVKKAGTDYIKEAWEACEDFYESRKCENCLHYEAFHRPDWINGKCGHKNECTQRVVENDFSCKFWE